MTGRRDGVTPEAEDLLTKWREQQDTSALGELLKMQRDRAYAIAFRVLAHRSDAEDAVQEAFIKLMSRTHGFEHLNAFRISVFRAVVQCATNLARSRGRYQTHRQSFQATRASCGTGTPQALSNTEREEMRAQIREALSNLPLEQRTAVVLTCQQGMNVSEAATVTGVARQTLSDRLSRAMARLRLECEHKSILPSALPGLLEMEGSVTAPDTLCRNLDQALAGRECAELAAEGPPQTNALALEPVHVTGPGMSLFKVGALSIVAAMGALTVVVSGPSLGGSSSTKQTDQMEIQSEGLQTENVSGTKAIERSGEMKKSILAGAAFSAMLMGAPIAGADDTASVADVLKEIRAHKAAKKEKKEAAARLAKEAYKENLKRYKQGHYGQGQQGSDRRRHGQ